MYSLGGEEEIGVNGEGEERRGARTEGHRKRAMQEEATPRSIFVPPPPYPVAHLGGPTAPSPPRLPKQ
ncbi:hypothetical protein BHM03_00047163, partial [Ensete ventricosum]